MAEDMNRQLLKFASALSSFASSPETFRIFISIPEHAPPPSSSPPSTLYVLDSSFNPPTLAHLHIATSAIQDHSCEAPSRLLLLLATQNADKAPRPAPFAQRLTLMTILAQGLRRAFASASASAAPTVDIGVTKHPYFVDKAASISASELYATGTKQVHLTGFDTLMRILDTKYYAPSYTLAPLEPFLSQHRLRVTYRTRDDWGDRAAQEAYVRALGDGARDGEGGRREWMEKIKLVEGVRAGEEGVSSTRAREVIKSGHVDRLRKLVPDGVAEWVLQNRLYAHD